MHYTTKYPLHSDKEAEINSFKIVQSEGRNLALMQYNEIHEDDSQTVKGYRWAVLGYTGLSQAGMVRLIADYVPESELNITEGFNIDIEDYLEHVKETKEQIKIWLNKKVKIELK